MGKDQARLANCRTGLGLGECEAVKSSRMITISLDKGDSRLGERPLS